MKFPRIRRALPSWKNSLLAILSAVLLILAFPDFEFWFLAWFALVPLLLGVEREKDSIAGSFFLGWIFGFVFFSGSCWWLTYAPIHYAAFPWPLAYLLLFCVTGVAGLFPALFAAIVSYLLKHFGSWAFLAVPFIWVATEFARYWITGNNWNAIGYSQAFVQPIHRFVGTSGVLGISFLICVCNLLLARWLLNPVRVYFAVFAGTVFFLSCWDGGALPMAPADLTNWDGNFGQLVAVQPNVPMAGYDEAKWRQLRQRQIDQAESALAKVKELTTKNEARTTVVLPESPMNFQWDTDPEFQQFISAFAAKNNVSVLFNSAEPDKPNNKYFNSAVMIDNTGREIAEYDKIYLLPFGEAVPTPLESLVPGFVGNFSYGKNYSLVPLGDAKAGIMICFESHFGELSRQYVKNGADAIIEMTNDGYLGPTPVLRQHLANAVFRAIETNRPVLRVTNVGITAYITERGEVLDATQPYTEDTRVWSVARSDGSQTFYVKYGDWFAWLCTIVTIMFLIPGYFRKKKNSIG
jgi:apolipoprotein N-acyltransferase